MTDYSEYYDDALGGVSNRWTKFLKKQNRYFDEPFPEFIKRNKVTYDAIYKEPSKKKKSGPKRTGPKRENPWILFLARHKGERKQGETGKAFFSRMSKLYHSGERAPLKSKSSSYGTFD